MSVMMKFRHDITPGDYLLMNDLDSMYVLAYSTVDRYEPAPFTVWVYDDMAFGYGVDHSAAYEIQKHGRALETLREWPSTWTWIKWDKKEIPKLIGIQDADKVVENNQQVTPLTEKIGAERQGKMGESDSGVDVGFLAFWALVTGIVILISGLVIYSY